MEWNFRTAGDYDCNGTVAQSGRGRLLEQQGQWQFVGPAVRWWNTLIWYPSGDCLIAFGGYDYDTKPLNDTWFYYPSNGTWIRHADGPTRMYHTAVWDDADGLMLVFGGTDGIADKNELWAYSPAADSWTKKAVGPAARDGQGAVWDSTNDQMIIFGGEDDNKFLRNDTWAYAPSTDGWTQLSSGPAPRAYPSAVWDPERKQMLVHGGKIDAYPGAAQDLWGYYPSNDSWARKADSGYATEGAGAVWDTYSKEMLVCLQGPMSYSPATDKWRTRSPNAIPPEVGAAAWSSNEARLYTYFQEPNNVWDFSVVQNAWHCDVPSLPYIYHTAVWDDYDGQMLVIGGMASHDPVEDWNVAYVSSTGKWVQKSPCPETFDRTNAIWDPKDRRVFVTSVGDNTFNRTWMYDPVNDTWARMADFPILQTRPTAVWDGKNDQILCYGNGVDGIYIYHPSTDIWEWKDQAVKPHSRSGHIAVWDESDGQMIIAGGVYYDSNVHYLDDVWSYDPVTNVWAQHGNMPSTVISGVGVWDSAHDLMLVVGGHDQSHITSDWAYNPPTDHWSGLPFFHPWSDFISAVWDRQGNRLLAYGGELFGAPGEYGGMMLRSYSMPFVANGSLTLKDYLLSEYLYQIGQVSFNSSVPAGTGLSFQISVSPDGVQWDGWRNITSGGIPDVQAKHVRWRALLNTSDPARTPSISNVTVNYITNRVPVVDATGPATSYRHEKVVLKGNGWDDDGDVLVYRWTQTGGPAININIEGERFRNASFTPDLPGVYSLSLGASDDYSKSISKNISISVLNRSPVVSADANPTAYRNETVELRGMASDEDNDVLSFNWSQEGGPAAIIPDAHQLNAAFVPTEIGAYSFRLSASDIYNGSAAAIVNVTVMNRPPSANAGGDLTVYVRSLVTINGTGQDDDNDSLIFTWNMTAGGKVEGLETDSSRLVFIPLDPVRYVFRLTESDSYDMSAPSFVNITVLNRLPDASAGPDVVTETGVEVLLNGSASDKDGDPLAYQWSQIGGPVVTILNASTAVASFVPVKEGSYSFQLTVNDSHAQVFAFLNVTVKKPYVPFSFSSIPSNSGKVGELWTYNISFESADPGKRLNITLINSPYGMTLNGRQLSWSPLENQTGNQSVRLAATDGVTTAFQNWTVQVSPKPAVIKPVENNSSSEPPWIIVIIVVVVAMGAGAAMVFFIKRRRDGHK